MTTLPTTEHIRLDLHGPVLRLWFNRPETRNALSATMVREISETFAAIRDDRGIRVVVMRGAGGTFCAGGDIKGMQAAGQAQPPGAEDELKANNRRYGAMLETVNAAPQAVIAVVEGYAMGGGVGFASVADVTIAHAEAQFAMSEVLLGVVPAAISPFVVQRIGVTTARRLAVTAARFDAHQAHDLGFVHIVADDAAALDVATVETINQVLKCGPEAIAETKRLMLRASGPTPLPTLLDLAAESFAAAVRGAEGREGTRAFVEKRKPAWVTRVEPSQ